MEVGRVLGSLGRELFLEAIQSPSGARPPTNATKNSMLIFGAKVQSTMLTVSELDHLQHFRGRLQDRKDCVAGVVVKLPHLLQREPESFFNPINNISVSKIHGAFGQEVLNRTPPTKLYERKVVGSE